MAIWRKWTESDATSAGDYAPFCMSGTATRVANMTPDHLGECRMEQSLIASPATLSARHAELDARLAHEEARPFPDSVIVAQIKKAKLQLKDALSQH
jgi:hypothetical protein